MNKYYSYIRVSTTKQGESGLGLLAQQSAIQHFISSNPDSQLLGEFEEIETGTNKRKRPKLHEALALCKANNATLLVATLSRLSRNVHFISGLVESKVNFIALDCPSLDRTMLYFQAVMAEWEASVVSKRTKAALAAAKSNGVKLGSPQNLTKEVRDKGRSIANEKSKRRAAEQASKIAPSILKMRLEGYTLRGVAAKLNEDKIPTVSGIGSWNASMVRRVVNYV